ncbi:MAG: hypothetical protein JW891_05015 [Candidatus Lokiarchaeota archaeon]|nr:hypothetical protein [Candidatus Lokiarchaeota archaeon]
MVRDLDELINDIENDALTRSELHEHIRELIQEKHDLTSRVEKLEQIVNERSEKENIEGEVDFLDDLQILKDMVKSQRQDLKEKDSIIEAFEHRNATLIDRAKHEREISGLKSRIDQYQKKIEGLNEQINQYKLNDSNAQQIIKRLTEENSLYKSDEDNSLKLFEEVAEKKEKYKNRSKQLEIQLEKLTQQFQEEKSKILSEFESQKEDLLVNKVEYARRISELESQLDKISQNPVISGKLNDQGSEKYETESKKYVDQISDLKTRLQRLSAQEINNKSIKEQNSDESVVFREKYDDKIKILQEENQKLKQIAKEARVVEEHVYIEKVDPTPKKSSSSIVPKEDHEAPIPIEFKPSINPSESILNAEEESLIVLESNDSSDQKPINNVIDGSRKCPKCGNQRKQLIHEELDKTNIIMAYPRLYGKKYRCGECGGQWRIRFSEIELLEE